MTFMTIDNALPCRVNLQGGVAEITDLLNNVVVVHFPLSCISEGAPLLLHHDDNLSSWVIEQSETVKAKRTIWHHQWHHPMPLREVPFEMCWFYILGFFRLEDVTFLKSWRWFHFGSSGTSCLAYIKKLSNWPVFEEKITFFSLCFWVTLVIRKYILKFSRLRNFVLFWSILGEFTHFLVYS